MPFLCATSDGPDEVGGGDDGLGHGRWWCRVVLRQSSQGFRYRYRQPVAGSSRLSSVDVVGGLRIADDVVDSRASDGAARWVWWMVGRRGG